MGAIVQIFQDEFRLHLGKPDAWDARHEYDQKKAIITQENLIRAGRDFGFRLDGENYHNRANYDKTPPPECEWPDDGQGFATTVRPCPKPVGWIRVLHSGHSSTQITTRLDIEQGIVRCEFDLEYGWHATGKLIITAFVDKNSNTVHVRAKREGNLGHFVFCIQKEPDSLDATIPLPTARKIGNQLGVVTQTIPAGADVAEFSWHLVGVFPGKSKGVSPRALEAHPRRLWQQINLADGASAELAIGIATDRDGKGDSAARAIALAQATTFDDARTHHITAWKKFWAASSIALEDQPLEAAWHRSLFALACHISDRGAMAPGLVANVVPFDRSPWHGLYTVNMNIQKMFLSSLPTNHAEWIHCYADWLDHMTPSLRLLAQETFGIEGVYSPHMILPFVPPHRQFTTNTCGRSIGMTGWHAQPLWWHWQFTRDIEFLRRRTYPYLSASAKFYARYIDKFMDESGDLYPTMNLEMPPWSRDFKRNRDCIIDVILVRATLEQAIKAAATLGVDHEWQQKWRAARERVRPVKYERLPGGEGFVHIDKNAEAPTSPDWWHVRENRWMCVFAAWAIFPGEVADGDEIDGLASIVRDIMTHMKWETLHPEVTWIHHWWCAIPALRMQLPEAFDRTRKTILNERFPAGHTRTTHWINLQPEAWRCPEDNYLAVAATTEMLLQSQGEVLRFFPGWPREKSASFRSLPARGGFVVSAELAAGAGLKHASIHSIANGVCTIRWNDAPLPTVRCDSQPVKVTRAGRDIQFEVRAGANYELIC